MPTVIWYISCPFATGLVETKDGIITANTAPIFKKRFNGKPLKELENWLLTKGELIKEEL